MQLMALRARWVEREIAHERGRSLHYRFLLLLGEVWTDFHRRMNSFYRGGRGHILIQEG
jgi:hypothetical protein